MPQHQPQVPGGRPVQNSGETPPVALRAASVRSATGVCNASPPGTQISIQRILLAVCERGAGTTNGYERHRILLVYHLFVSLLLAEVEDGLGGAWAFVLRDVVYTLVHHINSR